MSTDLSEVLAPVHAYLAGHATGDPSHFREAFLPSAHVEGVAEDALVSMDLDTFCSRFGGTPAPDEATRVRTIDQVAVQGTVASAVVTLHHGDVTFTDMFLLLEIEPGAWRIANKAYHRS
jgi:Putative lumazine-binding